MSNNAVDKKTAIIQAAIEVFADKGFKASTISDLAQKAGLAETTIYNHFKNKLEILLNIPESYIRDFVKRCEGQIKGLKDPEEKMRKYIWQTLRWCQNHKSLVKVVLCDIVTTHEFFESKAYGLMRNASQLPITFLDQGKEQGMFREDVNSRSYSVLLFGTISYLLLTRIMYNASFEILDSFNEMAGLIIAAIKEDAGDAEIDIHEIKNKKERILLAGENLFSQKMYAQTTISEIAKTAKVADGTIYEYFKNKDELLLRIFSKRMNDFKDAYAETISPKNSKAKLKLTVYHILSWVQGNRSWARVYIKDIVTNSKFYAPIDDGIEKGNGEDLLDIFSGGKEGLMDIFSEGKEAGLFRKDINPELFMAMVIGSTYMICLPWALLNQKHSLLTGLDDFYALLLRAIKEKELSPPLTIT